MESFALYRGVYSGLVVRCLEVSPKSNLFKGEVVEVGTSGSYQKGQVIEACDSDKFIRILKEE
jgi:hypothetical protein